MKRKLLLLNVLLAAVLVYAGWQFHNQWRAAKAREAATLSRKVKQAPAPPFTPLAQTPPVLPASYADIAQKDLFDRSRNPTVVVEAPQPPPPKPMPALPIYRGMMNLGEGPVAIMSMTPNGVHQAVHPGESIGPFKLVDVNSQQITLDWEGKIVQKNVDDILESSAPAPAAESRTAPPAAAPAPVAQTPKGPGVDVGKGLKACAPNDSTPAGTVSDGYRKVVSPTPFGESCRWEQVEK
ncbi:MAG TPA: hypothetical protein VG675_12690 [Bryobacteraceae bacterium]|nr:hypothetical protein [Bryobacteraceae bacterium]